ncbi:MAG: DedA family protein [Tannerella sp.]|jgi:membrane protein YqaA with SNARE-associated domain|nr:DedA family protein [Tannerella sp.]
MEYLIDYGYIGVFLASFLAATILPFSSEVILAGVLLSGGDYWACMVAATIGNVLGGMTCYWLGRIGKVEWIQKYLKINISKLLKVQHWINNKGAWVSVLTFLPVVGDLIAVALGFLRTNGWSVLFYMFVGKAVRYFIWMELVYRVGNAVI